LREHKEAKGRLVSLQGRANKLADQLAEITELLRKGPPYSTIPLTGFLDAAQIEKLLIDLHTTNEEKTELARQLKELE
jgi:hypothetical protein